MRKTIKTILKVVLILFAIIGVVFVIFAILLTYLMKNPSFVTKVVDRKKNNTIEFCKKQNTEKQNECFAILATSYKDNTLCDLAPDKNKCNTLIGTKPDIGKWIETLDN